MEKIYRGALLCIPGIGNARAKMLIEYFGSAQAVWIANKDDIIAACLLDTDTCNKFINDREKIDIYQMSSDWKKSGIQICTIDCPEYPQQLRTIFDPPQVLFYKGVLPNHNRLIAIVGARKATAYGKNAADMLASQLAEAGCWIVSGAARGIDTISHEGALTTGYTIAVLGNGLNVTYPPENAKLLARIAEQGAVISEYPPDAPPAPGQFPARNRIINGLSLGVIVVEAADKSGALITADYALEEGRDVFAVPGSIFSPSSKGTNRLIKQGAKLVENASDILEEYNISVKTTEPAIPLTGEELSVYQLLDFETPLGLEELALKSTLSVSKLSYILLQLELRGIVKQHVGQRYVRSAGRNLCE
jgi:DNA processing protein